ncbi:MAG: UDP-N-acetylmuramate dehydrogenase [Bacteroidales bacterium]|jgi:UDP-N-acetylmuramate dehydrogenase|nr:UDP-N-acetylmuramate dehydrogenase [Bacteroidales bacterium]
MIEYEKNLSLRPFNTFGIDVKADHLFHLRSREELPEILAHPVFNGVSGDINSVLVLGQGSNMLFTHDIRGAVIRNEITGVRVLDESEESVTLEVGAGVIWQELIEYAVSHDLAGIENLTLIPGTVGAAPVQNIGAYGVEAADVIVRVNGFHLEKREWLTLENKECGFGYRDSIFKRELRNKVLISSVILMLSKTLRPKLDYGGIKGELAKRDITDPSLRDISDIISQIRRAKLPDPCEIGNAGSFFKNPTVGEGEFVNLQGVFPDIRYYRQGELYKIPAGWLIEQSGWKGYRLGDAGCYDRQALILVNYGTATGEEILDLSEKIRRSVFDKFGIVIEREVNVI